MAYYPRIRDLREDSDKTQQEIAEYLGTSSQHYGKYELGHAEIPFERAIALAKFYGVSLDYIAGLTNSKKGFSRGELTEKQQRILEIAESLESGDKSRTAELLKAIAELIEK